MAFNDIYRNKRVLLTGHTGFKGSWMARWLLELGAEVHGLSLSPEKNGAVPPLFDDLRLANQLNHAILDVRDAAAVEAKVKATAPDVIFHLAAQPLVRLSYAEPVETFATNVMGTAHVLNAVQTLQKNCAVVIVTTDKCYENTSRVHGYREDDPMGGHDPYSASKGCAELVVNSFRRSFFSSPARNPRIAVASGRAGNVIGGGDWAADRIVPDCVRALGNGEVVQVRNPHATRPWQHVLEPLSGYLSLGALQLEALKSSDAHLWDRATTGYNFGPELRSNKNVRQLIEATLQVWPGEWNDCSDPKALHEASLLNLAIDKAHHQLNWRPVWNFDITIRHTMNWYRRRLAGESAETLTASDLTDYVRDAKAAGLAWAS